MAEIRHYLTIRAEPGAVYGAITKRDGLAAWWTEETTVDSEEGGFAEFRFGDRYHNKMEITALVPGKKVEWKCLEGDPEWIGTGFVFDIDPGEEGTILRFAHKDWREATDFFAHCNYHWGYYLRSLELLCETGEGTPFKA